MGSSRACAATWVNQHRLDGELGLHDRSSTPHQSPNATPARTLAEAVLYARPYDSEDERSAAIGVWNIHDNYHRPHGAAGGRPPASRLRAGVTNVQPSYT